MSRRAAVLALTLLATLALSAPARAGHHRWDFTEAFSNASGTVQFFEMIGGGDNEQGVGPFTVTTNSQTFNFVTNLGSTLTNGKSILVATSNFAFLSGVTPDYIIPSNFLSLSGGTLNYAAGADIWVYGALPTNGTLSLQRNGTTAANSPKNFAGNTGSVTLPSSLPAASRWGLALVMGAMLLAGSGLLRRRQPTTA